VLTGGFPWLHFRVKGEDSRTRRRRPGAAPPGSRRSNCHQHPDCNTTLPIRSNPLLKKGGLYFLFAWVCLDRVTGQASEVIRSPEQIPAAHAELYPPLFHALLDAGVYLPPSPWEVGFLSTAHDTDSIEIFVQAFAAALAALNLN